MNRRDWLKRMTGAGGALLLTPSLFACGKQVGDPGSLPKRAMTGGPAAKIAFVKTSDRAEGVRRAIELLGFEDEFRGKSVFLKPNYNSADPFPGSTDNDTLLALTSELRRMRSGKVTIGDRSGMGDTREVMSSKDVFHLAGEENASTVVFDELKEEDWKLLTYEGSNWKQGFAIPKQVLAADSVVQTCCLKTHRFGGHFTLSLKNSVGLAAKRIPGRGYNYMSELHSSPGQRQMIGEINRAYKTDLVVLDGVEAFTDGGPDKGTKVNSGVIIAGTDRVAVDAVGVAVLRHFGTTSQVSKGAIFEQEQIAEAARLGVGVGAADKISILTDGKESSAFADEIRTQFAVAAKEEA